MNSIACGLLITVFCRCGDVFENLASTIFKAAFGINRQIGELWFFVGRTDPGKVGNLAGPRTLVQTLDVAVFTGLEAALTVNLVEIGTTDLAHIVSICPERGNKRGQHEDAGCDVKHRHVPDGWLPAVKYLIEELGIDVNVLDHEGYSAIHNAAARGDNAVIELLVKHGADVMFVSRRGQTTVDMANGPQQRVQPFPETIALLEGLGAENNHNCRSC